MADTASSAVESALKNIEKVAETGGYLKKEVKEALLHAVSEIREYLEFLRMKTETYTDVNEAGREKPRTKQNKESPQNRLPRILDVEQIQNNKESIEEARERIKGQLDRALDITNNLIKSACQPAQRRRAQPWFDRTCYEERKETLRAVVKAKTSKNSEDLTRYAEKRKQYKYTIKVKKENYVEKKAQQMIEEAEKDPFWALKRKSRGVMKEIPIQNWQNHFAQILNKGNRTEAYEASTTEDAETVDRGMEITEDEITKGIGEAKNRKATGPDQIAYEHLNASADIFKIVWIELFNKCMKMGSIAEQWRRATLKILYKGKGSTEDMNSYRGVVLENTLFKIFMKI
ncbi:hypothetical protein ANN_17887 [Periplaneta americana]|uniref:Uncharacterized protein n=1 Tax=Periplaneta americana TaxID=6978 RepID=A0ABQ8SU75_PERAM|nr:hypothetical protein ANN_17887 [Periplaneta americana]